MNRRGFSLIEVMISMSIMMIISLAMMTLSVNLSKQMRYATLSINFQEFVEGVVLTVLYPSACSNALAGQPYVVGGTSNVVYKDISGTNIGAGVTFNGLLYTSVTLQDLGPLLPVPGQYTAYINFLANKTGMILGPLTSHSSIPVRLNIAGGFVVSCF